MKKAMKEAMVVDFGKMFAALRSGDADQSQQHMALTLLILYRSGMEHSEVENIFMKLIGLPGNPSTTE